MTPLVNTEGRAREDLSDRSFATYIRLLPFDTNVKGLRNDHRILHAWWRELLKRQLTNFSGWTAFQIKEAHDQLVERIKELDPDFNHNSPMELPEFLGGRAREQYNIGPSRYEGLLSDWRQRWEEFADERGLSSKELEEGWEEIAAEIARLRDEDSIDGEPIGTLDELVNHLQAFVEQVAEGFDTEPDDGGEAPDDPDASAPSGDGEGPSSSTPEERQAEAPTQALDPGDASGDEAEEEPEPGEETKTNRGEKDDRKTGPYEISKEDVGRVLEEGRARAEREAVFSGLTPRGREIFNRLWQVNVNVLERDWVGRIFFNRAQALQEMRDFLDELIGSMISILEIERQKAQESRSREDIFVGPKTRNDLWLEWRPIAIKRGNQAGLTNEAVERLLVALGRELDRIRDEDTIQGVAIPSHEELNTYLDGWLDDQIAQEKRSPQSVGQRRPSRPLEENAAIKTQLAIFEVMVGRILEGRADEITTAGLDTDELVGKHREILEAKLIQLSEEHGIEVLQRRAREALNEALALFRSELVRHLAPERAEESDPKIHWRHLLAFRQNPRFFFRARADVFIGPKTAESLLATWAPVVRERAEAEGLGVDAVGMLIDQLRQEIERIEAQDTINGGPIESHDALNAYLDQFVETILASFTFPQPEENQAKMLIQNPGGRPPVDTLARQDVMFRVRQDFFDRASRIVDSLVVPQGERAGPGIIPATDEALSDAERMKQRYWSRVEAKVEDLPTEDLEHFERQVRTVARQQLEKFRDDLIHVYRAREKQGREAEGKVNEEACYIPSPDEKQTLQRIGSREFDKEKQFWNDAINDDFIFEAQLGRPMTPVVRVMLRGLLHQELDDLGAMRFDPVLVVQESRRSNDRCPGDWFAFKKSWLDILDKTISDLGRAMEGHFRRLVEFDEEVDFLAALFVAALTFELVIFRPLGRIVPPIARAIWRAIKVSNRTLFLAAGITKVVFEEEVRARVEDKYGAQVHSKVRQEMERLAEEKREQARQRGNELDKRELEAFIKEKAEARAEELLEPLVQQEGEAYREELLNQFLADKPPEEGEGAAPEMAVAGLRAAEDGECWQPGPDELETLIDNAKGRLRERGEQLKAAIGEDLRAQGDLSFQQNGEPIRSAVLEAEEGVIRAHEGAFREMVVNALGDAWLCLNGAGPPCDDATLRERGICSKTDVLRIIQRQLDAQVQNMETAMRETMADFRIFRFVNWVNAIMQFVIGRGFMMVFRIADKAEAIGKSVWKLVVGETAAASIALRLRKLNPDRYNKITTDKEILDEAIRVAKQKLLASKDRIRQEMRDSIRSRYEEARRRGEDPDVARIEADVRAEANKKYEAELYSIIEREVRDRLLRRFEDAARDEMQRAADQEIRQQQLDEANPGSSAPTE